MPDIKRSDLEIMNDPNNEGQDLYLHEHIVVDKGQESYRIDKFLMDKLQHVSRSRIQSAIAANCIMVNDRPVKSNYKIRPLDSIMLLLPRNPNEAENVEPQDIPLDIIYEDDDLMIVNKPAGMAVHPGIGIHNGTLVNALVYYFQGLKIPILEGNTAQRPGLVHRIDKDTSGLLVIAKNDFAMTHLARQFFYHTTDREYLALVWGEPEYDNGTITGHIARHPTNPKKFYVYPDGDYGKHAITHFEVVERLYYVSLVKCKLETGRTHQIRVHMKYKGHPLFNDSRYEGDKILKGTIFAKYKQFVQNCFDILPRQGLHARSLGFIHPRTEQFMKFEIDMPEDMATVLDKWRGYVKSRKENLDKETE